MLLSAFLICWGILFVAYACLMLLYRHWFLQLKPFVPASSLVPKTSFSIIIPARNEALNIEKCLQHILQQTYPTNLFKIIVIDDFSTDDTPVIVQNLAINHGNIELIQLSKTLSAKPINSYKKKAIEMAVAQANTEWIITTDADCWMSNKWLAYYDAYIQEENPVMVGAPVVFTNNGSVLQSFQCIDFMTMQGVTAAAVSAGMHTMCNGANLAYQKAAFEEVEGFKGIDAIASGDDMLLMNKIKIKYPHSIGFLYSQHAIVKTLPMFSWSQFFNQRIRWASKADKYEDKSIFIVLLLMYLYNLILFCMPLVMWFIPGLWKIFVVAILSKTMIEISFAVPLARFFGVKLKWWHTLLQFHHIVYMVMAGWMGKFGRYSWKGRTVK